MFRCSFSQTIPLFFNRLKSDFMFVRSPQNFHQWLTMNWSLSKCIFRCEEIVVYLLSCDPENRLWSWKLTCFLTTCLSATLFEILILSAFLLKTARQNSFNAYHIILIMYILIMSETFIKIWFAATPWNFKTNLAYEPTKNPRYNIHCFDVMLIFPN